jgi:hypothetical protein
MAKTPELDKMAAIRDESQKIGEFLTWLGEQGNTICKFIEPDDIDDPDEAPNGGYYPVRKDTEQILADYFGIDLNKCEQERRDILEQLRG